MLDQKEIQLIFEAGKGTSSFRSVTAMRGDRVGALPSATRRGYVFKGWYTLPDGDPRANASCRVTSETPVTQDMATETVLYAHWEKDMAARRSSTLRTQKRVVVAMAAVAVLLIAVLVVVNYMVAIYDYVDTDGQAYTIQRKDGVYGLYLDGKRCDVNEEGYYLTRFGNQLEIDASTGAYEVYAVVDTSGTETLGTNRRVLLFKQLTYDATATGDKSRIIDTIEVHNQVNTMVVKRGENNRFYIDGHEHTALDDYLFAQLASGVGYNLSDRRLENPLRLEDGSVDLAEYGLVAETRTRTDEEGNEETYEYTPTWYKTTTQSGDTYTVTLGDAAVTGGYYAMFTDYSGQGGRDTVYILSSSNLDNAVLQKAEKLVTPRIVCPMEINAYFNVKDFSYYSDIEYGGLLRDMVYELTDGALDLYEVDTDEDGNLDGEKAALLEEATLEMESMDEETYAAFYNKHFKNHAKLVTAFTFSSVSDRENTLLAAVPYVMSSDYMAGYRPNANNITSMVLQKFYDATYDEVVCLGPDADDLAAYGLEDPAHVISFIYNPDKDGNGTYNLVHFSEKTKDGVYYAYSPLYDMIVATDESQFTFLEWDDIEWYEREYWQGNILFISDIYLESSILNTSLHFELDNSASSVTSDGTATVDALRIKANGKLVNYNLMVTKPVNQYVQETSVYNFQRFIGNLVTASLEETAELTEEEMASLRAQDDSACLLKMVIFENDGLGTKDSERYLVYRFYQVSERRAYMTIEVLDTPDLSTSNPQNAQGLFYVSASFCKKLVADAHRYMNGEEILSDSKI